MLDFEEEELLEDIVSLRHSVVIGSTGLGVSHNKSDIDICVLNSELRTIPRFAPIELKPIAHEDYEGSPLLTHSRLYTVGDLDIFIFTDPQKLVIMENVMDKLNNYPKAFTRIKWIRIKMFRYYLHKYNF